MSPPNQITENDFLRLFLKHATALQAFARVFLPTWESVDEVLQRAAVIMWKKLDQLDSEDGFLPWAKVSNELRLPPDTDYLMLRIGMSNDTKSQDKRRDSFIGHFVDKLQLVIARRSEIPVP